MCPCFASRQIKLLNTTCNVNVVSKNHKAKSKLSIICFRVVLDTSDIQNILTKLQFFHFNLHDVINYSVHKGLMSDDTNRIILL